MGLFRNQLSGPTDPATDAGWSSGQARMGFFTDTSICIGCKACEVACKEWNAVPADVSDLTGTSYDNTGALGANTWRHVAFIEQGTDRIARARETGRLVDLGMPGLRPPDAEGPPARGDGEHAGAQAPEASAPVPDVRWLMSSDVCKHCTHAGCLDVCPTGSLFRTEFGTVVVQPDICNGCGYCIPACPFGVIERRQGDSTVTTGVPNEGVAQKCTLCYDRIGEGLTPACAQACPTESIQFGSLAELRQRAEERVATLHAAGHTDARLYGDDPQDGVGGLGAFFLLLDEPEVYGLPPDPRAPTADLAAMFRRAGYAGLAMLAAGVAGFLGRRA